MKKLSIFIMLLIAIITLSACDQLNQALDDTDPEFSGIEDVTIVIGGTFNVMQGVTASDDTDGDITDDITYAITDEIGNPISIDLNVEGVYYITYTVSDKQGNTATVERTLTINQSGISDDVVHVLLDTLSQAEDRLEQFYYDVLESNLTPLEVCSFYIGDVPFPINDTTVTECVEGISEVRNEVMSATILSVVVSTYEGHNTYKAEVTLYDSSLNENTGFVEFAFLTKETLSDEYIHFYGDPFMHDDDGEGISLDRAKQEVEYFYDSFFDVYYNTSDFCSDVFGMIMEHDKCMELVDFARDVVTGFDVYNINHTQVTFPDGNVGEGFGIDIIIYVENDQFEFRLEFFFVTDPFSGDIISFVPLNDPLGGIFGGTPDTIMVPPSEARPLIENLYNELLDESIPVIDVCSDYISKLPFFGPELSECIDVVNQMRGFVVDLDIFLLTSMDVEFGDGEFRSGYDVEIHYTTEVDGYVVHVPVVFVQGENEVIVVLMNHPLGMDDYPEIEFIEIPIEDVTAQLDSFYSSVEDNSIDLYGYCAMMMEGLPIEDDYQECADGLNNLRMGLESHMILNVYQMPFEEEGMYGTIYEAEIDLYGFNNEQHTIFVKFGFVQTEFGLKLWILTNPGGEEQHIDTIMLPMDDAYSLISDFYIEIFDEFLNVEAFCSDYMSHVTFEGPNYDECVDTLYDVRQQVISWNINGVSQETIEMDGMYLEGYKLHLEFDIGNGPEYSDIPFVFIGDYQYPIIMLLSHPLGFNDQGYMMLVQMDMDTAMDAIDEFYMIMADPNYDLYQFCNEYMGGLPFPNEPMDIENCANGLMNLRMGLSYHVVHNVYNEYLYMGGMEGPGFIADIELFDLNGVGHPIQVMFGFIDTEYGPKFMLFSNPGGDDNEPDQLLELPHNEVQMMITQLYNDIFTYTDINLLCNMYLDMIPSDIDHGQCTHDWAMFKDEYMAMQIMSIEDIYIERHYIDGPGYLIMVELERHNGELNVVEMIVGFVGTQYGPRPVLFNTIFGHYPEPDYNVVLVDELTAELLLIEIYDKLFDLGYNETQFCLDYIQNDVRGPSMEECTEAVVEIRSNYTNYGYGQIYADGVQVGEYEVLPGFIAPMILTGVDVVHEFDLRFIVTDYNNDGAFEFIFMGHPAGMDEMNHQFIDVPVHEAEMYLEYFYGDLLDPYSNEMTFCEEYIFGSPFTSFDPNTCGSYVLGVKQLMAFYVIESVVETDIMTPEGPAPGFLATITITHDGNVSYTFDIEFAFIPSEMGMYLVFFTDDFIQGEPTGSVYADLNEIDAMNLISQFYMAFNDPNIPNDLMCQVYLPLAATMQPLENGDCMNFMLMNRFDGSVYTVSLPVFFPGENGGPPFFVTNITRTNGLDIDNYEMFFIFLIDQNGQVLPAMDIEQAVGVHDMPMYNYTTMSIQEAIPWIQQFMFDAFDPTLPPELFCMMYSGPVMFDMQPICEEVEYYQMLEIVNDYSVDNIVEFYEGGIQHFRAYMTEMSIHGPIPYYVDFAFILDEADMPWLIPVSDLVMFPNIEVELDETLLHTYLDEYYINLFDFGLATPDFCNMYLLNNPFYEGTEQDCIDGRAYALSRLETYVVGNIMLENDFPFPVFSAEISVTDNGYAFIYHMTFTVIYFEGLPQIVLFDELIHDVPMP